ncbi:MAG: phospho-sugar mutase, partial [Bacteroidales bacterium]
MEAVILQKAKVWLSEVYDEQTRKEVQNLIDGDPSELSEAFYRNLEFGTGGLRGIIGVGTNRMNVYTVAIATQGFANYIKKSYPQGTQLKVAIACDSRHKSSLFSEITARVFAANDFKVYLFMGMRPTPELSFAVRHFNCCAGVMITASHNPKEYNGYKAYWSDGGQLVAPHDSNVIKEVEKITDFTQVKLLGKMGEDIETAMKEKPDSIEWIGIEVDNAYLAKVKALSLSPQAIAKQKNFKMVYTPLHGTGATLVPRVLRELGFESLSIVADQAVPDGDFPTVKSPNPEEKAALQMA